MTCRKKEFYKPIVPRSLIGAEGGTKNRKYERYIAPNNHEESIARELGGRKQLNSGALPFAKGDVTDVDGGDVFSFVIECKTTQKQSLRVKAGWLHKVACECPVTKYPALALRFEKRIMEFLANRHKDKGIKPVEEDWICIPLSVFKSMLLILGSEDIEL